MLLFLSFCLRSHTNQNIYILYLCYDHRNHHSLVGLLIRQLLGFLDFVHLVGRRQWRKSNTTLKIPLRKVKQPLDKWQNRMGNMLEIWFVNNLNFPTTTTTIKIKYSNLLLTCLLRNQFDVYESKDYLSLIKISTTSAQFKDFLSCSSSDQVSQEFLLFINYHLRI